MPFAVPFRIGVEGALDRNARRPRLLLFVAVVKMSLLPLIIPAAANLDTIGFQKPVDSRRANVVLFCYLVNEVSFFVKRDDIAYRFEERYTYACSVVLDPKRFQSFAFPTQIK